MILLFEYTKKEPVSYKFSWDQLGDIALGRENLGPQMPVVVYRLLEYCMKEVLDTELGKEKMIHIFREAGFIAGRELAHNMLDLSQDIHALFGQLQDVLKNLQIGIFRVEKIDEATGTIYVTVAEDLDCSGLPISGEPVCFYDEGLIKGILDSYTQKAYRVKEIDCWSTGARVCRFKAEPEGQIL